MYGLQEINMKGSGKIALSMDKEQNHLQMEMSFQEHT